MRMFENHERVILEQAQLIKQSQTLIETNQAQLKETQRQANESRGDITQAYNNVMSSAAKVREGIERRKAIDREIAMAEAEEMDNEDPRRMLQFNVMPSVEDDSGGALVAPPEDKSRFDATRTGGSSGGSSGTIASPAPVGTMVMGNGVQMASAAPDIGDGGDDSSEESYNGDDGESHDCHDGIPPQDDFIDHDGDEPIGDDDPEVHVHCHLVENRDAVPNSIGNGILHTPKAPQPESDGSDDDSNDCNNNNQTLQSHLQDDNAITRDTLASTSICPVMGQALFSSIRDRSWERTQMQLPVAISLSITVQCTKLC
jgi:hypothetical protein